MNADNHHEAINALTATIIGAAHTVSNTLGAGFLGHEKPWNRG